MGEYYIVLGVADGEGFIGIYENRMYEYGGSADVDAVDYVTRPEPFTVAEFGQYLIDFSVNNNL